MNEQQAYLEQNVYPVLLPALEDLLRWVQSHDSSMRSHRDNAQNSQTVPSEWLAQYLKRNNPRPHQPLKEVQESVQKEDANTEHKQQKGSEANK
ncbi:hypothetical protein PROFUN_11088 [Planoprotostelium fungivorum]|uniref:Uncharacterized protein n=1 Tax=Planoprotostelium fungivorum TaxID=1890364 RepID=A0A2P6NAJ4_9EUKA|nr:hypothetical protein PROFUN_11088 [Planoprotostelium fungivorum]